MNGESAFYLDYNPENNTDHNPDYNPDKYPDNNPDYNPDEYPDYNLSSDYTLPEEASTPEEPGPGVQYGETTCEDESVGGVKGS